MRCKAIFQEDICKGCGLCIMACPLKILALDETKINAKGYHPVGLIDADKCTGCASCAKMCPDVVIEIA